MRESGVGSHCRQPVTPFPITQNASAAELVERMGATSFQARSLASGTEVWSRMLRGQVTILLGLAGAMIPAGMREVMVYLIENRLIDCLVSTGANLFHDLHETLGNFHWQGSHEADDKELLELQINRIYDVFANEKEFLQTDNFITEFSAELDQDRAYTTREYLNLLGERLCRDCDKDGILTAAARNQVPIYCPALGDSSIGIAIAEGREKKNHRLFFDIIQDIIELTRIVTAAPSTGVIYIGGGTPKNFIQQAEVSGVILGKELRGHKYAVQVTADSPQWGGLSGCTFEEAQSWKKIDVEALTATVYGDACIVLPLMVSALAETCVEDVVKRPKPQFVLGRELEIR